MKRIIKGDLLLGAFLVLLVVPFVIVDELFQGYRELNHSHPYLLSFIKFFILASTGEIIGQRIRKGNYSLRGFGLFPRAIVWGFLGISIKMAFVVFGFGAPIMLESMGLSYSTANPAEILDNNFLTNGSWLQFLTALTVSTTLNVFFAPVFMTVHKITDTHISSHRGKLRSLWTPIQIRKIIKEMDWGVQWGFVFKKTIPLFWIPAQTLNFLLPAEYRVLVAAVYSIILGVILAIAASMGETRLKA